MDLLSGENGKGEKLEDPNNLSGLTKSANQAFNYPSINSYLYGMNQLKEGSNYGRSPISIWDQKRAMILQKPIEWTPQQKADIATWQAKEPPMTAQQKRDYDNYQMTTIGVGPMEEFRSLKEYYNSPEYKAWMKNRPDIPNQWGNPLPPHLAMVR